MDHLVFVHGVNTREGPEYDQEVARRDQLFKEVAWQSAPLEVTNTYWGGSAATFSGGLASLPGSGPKAASFGFGGAPSVPAGQIQPLTSIGKIDFGAALDAIFVAMVEQAEAAKRSLNPNEIDQFREAGNYALNNPNPDWAKSQDLDSKFVDELRKRLPKESSVSFGMFDAIGRAAEDIADRARNLVSSGLAPIIRDKLSPRFAQFLGDIFVYLYGGGQPQKRTAIRELIAGDLNAASRAARDSGGKLVVIGHSLGGVILYDMLTDPQTGLDTALKVDLFVSVGSQPGIFQELSLFAQDAATAAKARAPTSADRWWNVFDPVDLLSFRCAPIFDKVEDFEFSSATGIIDAHTTYFKRPRFYARFRERLKNAGIVA